MKLERLELRDFRSYRGEHSITFTKPLLMLIGENNAGKSNLLEALRLLRSLVFGTETRSLAEYVYAVDAPSASIRVEMILDASERQQLLSRIPFEATVRSGFNDSQLLRKVALQVSITNDGHIGSYALEFTNAISGWLPILSGKESAGRFNWSNASFGTTLALRQVQNLAHSQTQNGSTGKVTSVFINVPGGFSEELLSAVKGFMGRWLIVPPVRQIVPRVQPAQAMQVVEGGKNVVQVLNHYQTEEPDEFPELAKEIARILPNLSKLKAPLRGGHATVFATDSGAFQIDISNFGTGVQQVLILVVSLMTLPKNSLVIMDEPEIHLHAGSQRALLSLMRRLAKERAHQILATTHSTVFARAAPDLDLRLVSKADGHSSWRTIDPASLGTEVKAALGHANTDLYGYRAVVLVEGETEEASLPILAEKLGIDLEQLGVRIVNVRGADKIRNQEQLLRFLAETGTEAHVWFDANELASTRLADLVREGLVSPSRKIQWPLDFEDCFPAEVVVSAAEEIAKAKGKVFSGAVTALTSHRQSGKPTTSWVSEKFHSDGIQYDKPDFGVELARALPPASSRPLTAPETQLVSLANAIR